MMPSTCRAQSACKFPYLLARVHVAVAQEYLYARSGRRILHAAGRFCKERVVNVAAQQAHGL